MAENIKDFLKKKLYTDRKYVLELLITSNSDDSCLNKILSNKPICDSCSKKVDKELKKYYSKNKVDFDDDTNKINVLFGLKGIYKGGRRFILEVPPKSSRNISKNKKRLRGYREIVKFKMKEKNINKFPKNDKLLLYMGIHVKNYFDNTDCDNLAKSIMDALEGIIYFKDSQVNVLIAEKIRVRKKINEGIIISIKKYAPA